MNTAVKERPQHLTLDQTAIDAASKHLDDGAVTPSYGPWCAPTSWPNASPSRPTGR
jgi:hypothetical protein